MANKYKVSVIIPVYNASNTIENTVQSILSQTFDDYELILINDGSTDGTDQILSNFKNFSNVKIVNQQNKGVSSSRNRGIQLSNGEYITFVDSDDFLDYNYLEIMYDFANKYQLDLVSSNHDESNSTVFNGNCNFLGEFISEKRADNGKHFFDMFPKSACAKLFNKKIISEYNLKFPSDMDLGEDLFFTFSFMLKVNRIGKVDNVCYHIQNVNLNSLSKKYVEGLENSLKSQYALWTSVFDFYPEACEIYHKTNPNYKLQFLSMYANNLFKKDCILPFNIKVQMIKKYIEKNKFLLDGINFDFTNSRLNAYNKIICLLFSLKNSLFIALFFLIKEKIKLLKIRRI